MEFLDTIPWLLVHVNMVFITLFVVVIADMHALLWLFGKMKTLPQRRMELLHRLVWTGLAIVLFAGVMMFKSFPVYYLDLWAFRFKLLFIGLLILNAIFIGKHLRLATETPFAAVSPAEKRALIVSGLVSALGWIGAFTMAKLL